MGRDRNRESQLLTLLNLLPPDGNGESNGSSQGSSGELGKGWWRLLHRHTQASRERSDRALEGGARTQDLLSTGNGSKPTRFES